MGTRHEVAQRLFKCKILRFESGLGDGILGVAVRVDFVATGAEVGRLRHAGCSGEEAGGEVRRLGRHEAELTGGRLVGVSRPGRRTGASDVLRVRLCDDGGVAGGVNFHHNVDTALRYDELGVQQSSKHECANLAGVADDIRDILGGVDGLRVVCTLLSDVGVAGDLERKALTVHNVPVEDVLLDPGHGVKSALDVRHREAVGEVGQSQAP